MRILYWHYDDGKSISFYDEIDETSIGWHCWVFTDKSEHQYFLNWLQLHIRKGYDAQHRFNSGDPMTTLKITDNDEALKFKEYWREHFEPY
jgi:hypothetical protein